MKINFNNAIEDLVTFDLHNYSKYNTKKTIMALRLMVPVVAGIILSVIYFSANDAFISMSYLCLILSVIGFIFYPKMFKARIKQIVRRKAKKNNSESSLINRQVDINDRGLNYICDGNSLNINWNSIKKVEVVEKYIFIYIAPLKGIVIPKRELQAIEEEQLIDQLKNKISR